MLFEYVKTTPINVGYLGSFKIRGNEAHEHENVEWCD